MQFDSADGLGEQPGNRKVANFRRTLAVARGWNRVGDDHLVQGRLVDSLQRRTVSIEFVQAQSIANKKQLETREPEERKKVLADLSETASDAARAKAYLLRSSMISMQRRAAAITLEEAA